MRKVDKKSPLPLYYQLKEILLEMIENEELIPGDMAPPERELSEYHGISRMTVRKAIMDLVRAGILYREQGKGTYVAKPKPVHQLNQLLGFTEEMRGRGFDVQTKLLSFRRVPASRLLRKQLQLEQQVAQVIELVRMRYVDDEPYALERVWLNGERFRKLEPAMIEENSLYDVLKEHYFAAPHWARQTIEPIQLNREEAKLFSMPIGTLALLFCRTAYQANDEVLEYTKCIYRADQHKYEVMLTV
ncbi:transcriptional regulator, GntR family [Seinonella peptonophila]|uniref:Transcriptional regulator, GntR family n=1 Tax=Seinonella peptonophila TaxID=112248 RepID=A0A1M4VM62_9BACL|nr:GntR family transcriptional regulator [Seinonella peptonophila]SHE70089.1 transcriptional regulator, GntR family [Seinonella peptonophila]